MHATYTRQMRSVRALIVTLESASVDCSASLLVDLVDPLVLHNHKQHVQHTLLALPLTSVCLLHR